MTEPPATGSRRPGIVDRLGRTLVSLESPAVVVAAVKRTSADLGIAAVAEPLEVLCRSLEREADLRAPQRRAARRRLVAALVRRAELLASPPGDSGPAAPLVISAAPGSVAAAALCRRLVESAVASPPGPPADTDMLEPLLASPTFELDWHVPAYGEWLMDADLTDAYATLGRIARGTAPGAVRPLLSSWIHAEHTSSLLAALPGAVIVRVESDPESELNEAVRHAVEARRRNDGQLDPATAARYWSWRLETRRLSDTTSHLTVESAAIDADPDAAVADVCRTISLCQADR